MDLLRHTVLLLLTGSCLVLGTSSCGSSRAAGSSSAPEQDLRSEYAERLNVKAKELGRMELYRFVDEWEGTPYAYGGQSRKGVDCSGFVGELYRQVQGMNLPREVEAIYKECDRTFRREQKLEEGDLVFFDIKKGKKASHAGVYLKNGHFVHASTSSGVVISQLSNPYYEKHFHRGGRMR